VQTVGDGLNCLRDFVGLNGRFCDFDKSAPELHMLDFNWDANMLEFGRAFPKAIYDWTFDHI
jgi:hypothetical protein